MNATVVESGSQGAEFFADKAETLANDIIELVKQNVPEKLDEVKAAFNDFASSNDLPFQFHI